MDVAGWLRTLGLDQYETAFRENSVTADLIPKLTPDDLKDLGVTSVGHRRRLLEAIDALRSNEVPVGNPGPAPQSLATPSASTAERRPLSVMFCDVVGFTTLSSRLDPEDLNTVIRRYQACVSTTIARFGGFIARYVGDGVLTYFGWPEAHEADAEQAVRAALAVIDAVAVAPELTESLRLRIGIATGLVVVGEPIGSGDARQQTAVGETPNLAARLQGLAEPNSVVIDGATRRQIGGLFNCRNLGPVTLKGLPEPVPAWQVVEAAAVESRFEALHAATMTPLIGRDEEIELLLRRWRQAAAGEGQLVLLCGEPGIGKSRLIAELEARLHSEPHESLRYFCSPHHRDSALYPVVTRWEQDLRFTRNDTASDRRRKLEAALAPMAMALEDAALIADLLSVPVDSRHPALDFTPQRKKEKIFEALVRGLAKRARRQPVLMLFEDAHWADASSLDLLDKTIALLADLPVLLVVSFRPELQPPWVGLSLASLVTLRRLTQGQAAQLAERTVIERALPPMLLHRIVAQTDGVPLFIEELTKSVLESADGSDRTAALLEVPATLQASLIARLDRLPTAKQVAQIGAVIGREFTHPLLAAVARMPEAQLADGIDTLVASGLAFRRGLLPDADYTFKHALVRDAAYSTLLRSQRQELHARIGSILETQFPETADAEPEVLAHHFAQAGLADNAVRYWHRAGERALQRSANAEASAHLARAIDILVSLTATPERNRTELNLQMALGTATRAMTGHASDESLRVYSRARALLDASVAVREQISVLYGLWSVNVVRCEHMAARDVARQSLASVANDEDPEAVAFANRMTGYSLWATGDSAEAVPHLEQVVALFAPGKGNVTDLRYSQDHAVWALVALALAYWHLGYPEKSSAATKLAFSWARQIGHAMTTGFAFSFGAVLNGLLPADPQRDRALSDEALTYCVEQDLRAYIPWARFYKGLALARHGQSREGLELMRTSMAAADEIKMKTALSMHLGHLGSAHNSIGEASIALEILTDALAAVNESGERVFEAELYRLQAVSLLQLERTEYAEQALDKALVIARAQKARMWELRAATMLARMWRSRGRAADARGLLTPIYRSFDEGLGTADLTAAGILLRELKAEDRSGIRVT